ncbi:hypothetical protein GCM10028857_15860 [Salinarchaeum chitinilyticum]
MRYLAAVDTVHTAAALCDYLDERADGADEVVAVAVHEPSDGDADPDAPADERDGQEALNVIGVRLALPDVETVQRRGDAATELLAVASERDVDEIVLGRRAGTPAASADGLGATADAVLADADRPVVVLPVG